MAQKLAPPLPSIIKSHGNAKSRDKLFISSKKDTSPYNLPYLPTYHSRSNQNLKPKSQVVDIRSPSSSSGNPIDTLTSQLLSLEVPKEIIKTYQVILASVPSKFCENFISRELFNISSSSSLIHKCLKSYRSWKESLVTLQEMTNYLSSSPGWSKLKDVVNECSSSLLTHILLALNAAETVLCWKNNIKTELRYRGFVPFVYHSEEFLEEFVISCDFLVGSNLSNAFTVIKNDPFLLNIARDSVTNKKNQYNFSVEKNKIFLNLNKKIIERIRQVQLDIEKDRELALINSPLKKSPLKTSLLTNTYLNPMVPDNNSKLAKRFSEKILNKIVNSLVDEVALAASLEEITDSIQEQILSSVIQPITGLVNEAIMDYTNEISSKKAEKLHLFNITESIVRNYIEEEIIRANLEELCETELHYIIGLSTLKAKNSEAKRRLTRISMNLETDKLSDMVYHSLIEDFINENWLIQLLESSIEVSAKRKTMIPLVINNKPVQEIEDFALEVFTPGVHSPNEILSERSIHEKIEIRISDLEAQQKIFSKSAVKIKLVKIMPIEEPFSKIDSVIRDYYSQGINEIDYILSPDDILEERSQYLNTQYFWIMENQNICGFYCYSTSQDGLIIIHHISCLNFKLFDELLNKFTEIAALKNDAVFQFKDPVLAAKNVLSVLKKNKILQVDSQKKIKEFLWKSGKNASQTTKLSLSSVCAIETTSAAPYNKKTCQEMIKIGNRHSIISLILSFYTTTEELVPNFDETPIRLQQDLNELIEILFYQNFRAYDLISVQDSLPEQVKLSKNSSLNCSLSKLNPSVFSVIDLSFSLSSCYFTEHSVKNTEYKYFIFTRNVKIRKELGITMFVVYTNDPEIILFFIKSDSLKSELAQGLKLGKTDLFYCIDNLIKALGEEEEFSEEFWVPCFEVICDFNLPWIEGYCINTSGSNFVIANCDENLRLSFKYEQEGNRSLKFVPEKKYCFEDDFVFGVYSRQVLKNTDSPFYAVLVGKENFQKARN